MENDRHLQFVLRNYREGAFDTRNAIGRFNKSAGRPNRRFMKYIAGAAAAVVLAALIFYPAPQHEYFATTDASDTFILPDSTSVTLAPNSSIEYDARKYSRRSRSVRMEGKAFFDVTRNGKVPFEITTSKAYVKVLGTSFQVDETADTEVAVETGKVFFAESRDAEGVILTRGMKAVLKAEGGRPEIQSDPMPNPSAWATGLFEYESVPLKDVLDELSEFYGVRLTASDYDRRLSAKFETSDSIDEIIGMISIATRTNIYKSESGR